VCRICGTTASYIALNGNFVPKCEHSGNLVRPAQLAKEKREDEAFEAGIQALRERADTAKIAAAAAIWLNHAVQLADFHASLKRNRPYIHL
jgi:hypothetical protein